MRESKRVTDAIILGGGISGLASAYFLFRKGISSTLVEAQPRLGGLIQTDYLEGCKLEAGPDSYLASKQDVTRLADEIPELRHQLIPTNDEQRRIFLVRDGTLVPLPSGMVMMVPGDMRAALSSDLFSEAAKTRMLAERFFKPLERARDVSIAEFVTEHFGAELLERVTEPLLAGVYGGNAGKLSATSVLPRFLEYERRYGSLIRGVRAERKIQQTGQPSTSLFLSFRGGMQALTDALARASADTMTRVTGEAIIAERGTNNWKVRVGNSRLQAKYLVVALPAHRAAPVLATACTELADELTGIPYSSAITIVMVYRRDSVQHPLDGFGFLAPRSERKQVAACTWIKTKFPHRLPDELVALRAFIVDKDADGLMKQVDEEILKVVRAEFRRLMGIAAEPVFHTLHRWPLSMPQYVVGHGERWRRIQGLVSAERELSLVGNAYDGVGIPDCVRLARRAVELISQRPAHQPV